MCQGESGQSRKHGREKLRTTGLHVVRPSGELQHAMHGSSYRPPLLPNGAAESAGSARL